MRLFNNRRLCTRHDYTTKRIKNEGALGQRVKVSLPKAFQINKAHSKSLVIKGVPTDITESEFKEFLDINKISFAKAERLKSQKDGLANFSTRH